LSGELPVEEQIRRRACQRYAERARLDGLDLQDRIRAEEEVRTSQEEGLEWNTPWGKRNTENMLQKIAASNQFQKSKRLRDLLLYLGERSLKDPNCILQEQEIGVEVFGRRADYDTSHDTLVRVHVSQLSKKLQDFFLAEGREESLIIEIPKGSYVPVFRPRTDPPLETKPERPSAVTTWRSPFPGGIPAGLALIGLAWGFSARPNLRPARPPLSVVDAF
jgi:hypothetical protein